MVYSVHKEMERSPCSSAKIERKIIEKNRRNHMKNLYSRLNSLLPRHTSKVNCFSLFFMSGFNSLSIITLLG